MKNKFAFLLLLGMVISFSSSADAQVNCSTLTTTNNGTATATVVYDDAIDVGGTTYDLRGTTTGTTGGKVVTFACVGGLARVQVQSGSGSIGTATVSWEALDAASNPIILQNFFFELVDLDGPNIEYAEFSTGGSYCTDSAGTLNVSTMGTTVTVAGTANNPADALQLNGSGGFSFSVTYGVSLSSSTNRFFDHGLMTGEAADLLDTCVGCGDGTIDADEGCDDSNWEYGDACSSGCLVSDGFACGTVGLTGSDSCELGLGCNTTGGPPGICQSTCPDGNADPGEACDDGNSNNNDACSNECLINVGNGTCSINIDCDDAAMGVECNSGVCEWGFQEGPCDGNEDCEGALVCSGATSTCLIATGNGTCTANADCESAKCNTGTGICVATICGDGVLEGNEECDDGGTTGGDGCDANCNFESGCFSQTPSYAVSQTNTGVNNPNNALGAPDGSVAELRNGDSINLFFDVALPAGSTVTIYANTNNVSNGEMTISESTDGMTYGAAQVFNSFMTNNVTEQVTYTTTSAGVEYIRIVRNRRRIRIDAITFSEFINCDTCGDGSVDVGEECDDNNATNGDGCSDNCVVDPTATCMGEPSVCTFPATHSAMGYLRWNHQGFEEPILSFETVSEAGALAYLVDWGYDADRDEHVTVTAAFSPTGAAYETALPPGGDPNTDAVRIRELDASGAVQLVFEGKVPAEGLLFSEGARERAGLKSVGMLPSSDTADSVAIYLPSAGIYAVPVHDLSEMLGLSTEVLVDEIESGGWGVTAEGAAVPTAFSIEDEMLYIASRWREHPSTRSIAHLFQPIETSLAVLDPVSAPEMSAETVGPFARPIVGDPTVVSTSRQAGGPKVVATAESTAFEGRVRIYAERDEFAGLAAAPPADVEYWFWGALNGGNANSEVFEEEVFVDGDAWSVETDLNLRFFAISGATGVTQTLRLEINGETRGEVEVLSQGTRTVTFKTAGALRTGANTIRVRALTAAERDAAPDGFLFIDGFRLEATGRWSSLTDERNGHREYVTEAFDRTSRALPSPIAFGFDDHRFVLAADGFSPRAERTVTYWAGLQDTDVVFRGFDSASLDTLLDNRVDHLVFAAHGLESAGSRLSAWRESAGMSSTTVRLPDVFDAFGDANAGSKAIRNYLVAYRDRWGEIPTYIVLLGAGAIDRDSDPTVSLTSVPPMMVSRPDGLYATHTYLADFFETDENPIHVGQIPARTLEEAMAVVDKIEHFESLGAEAWVDRRASMSVGENRGIDFSRVLTALTEQLDPRLDIDSFDANSLPAEDRTETFLDLLRDGTTWFNYIGHGALGQLGDGPIVRSEDFAALASSLDDSGAYAFFTAMSCTTSRSEIPGFESVGEKLLTVERGGAIAVWGPSGTSKPKYTLTLSKMLGEKLIEAQGASRVGDIIAAAKRDSIVAGVPEEEFDVFLLFGDPATSLPRVATHMTTEPPTTEPPPTVPPTSSSGGCAIGRGMIPYWGTAGVLIVLLGIRRRQRFRSAGAESRS